MIEVIWLNWQNRCYKGRSASIIGLVRDEQFKLAINDIFFSGRASSFYGEGFKAKLIKYNKKIFK